MNFVFISPQFPENYWNFCASLRRNGANVLGIGDQPYETLTSDQKRSLTEYYRVSSLGDYDSVYRAVAFFAFKYGKIDWIESNNEFWLEQDARLRTEFNVATGVKSDKIGYLKAKSKMKERYQSGGIPTARQIKGSAPAQEIEAFVELVGFPVIVKPDVGVGAGNTYKIESRDSLLSYLASDPHAPQCVIEEFMSGKIYSYDAIINSAGEPVFESMGVWPPSIMDIVNNRTELTYLVDRDIEPELQDIGRRTVRAFAVASRFVHLEFFKLDSNHPGLGDKGTFAALEVNMRPAGGYTPDMMNYAQSCNVYQIWADMVAYNERRDEPAEKSYCCAYTSRRNMHAYAHSLAEINAKYGKSITQQGPVADVLADAMGNYYLLARFDNPAEAREFIQFTTEHEQANT